MAGVIAAFFNGSSGLEIGDPGTNASLSSAYVAGGAFTNNGGFTVLNSLADFESVVQSLLTRTDGVSDDATTLSAIDATNEFVLVGGNGGDTLRADSSDSGLGTLIGGAGADTITGGSGLDTINGGTDADSIHAGAGDDTVDGGAGEDRIFGELGNDVLISDGSGDYLNGAKGSDTYAFTAFTDQYVGKIGYLDEGVIRSGPIHHNAARGDFDIIDLSGAATALGLDHFTEVNAFDGVAGEMVAKFKPNATDGRTLFLFDTDGDGRADHKIVVTHGDHTDFNNFVGVDTSALVL